MGSADTTNLNDYCLHSFGLEYTNFLYSPIIIVTSHCYSVLVVLCILCYINEVDVVLHTYAMYIMLSS